MNKKFFALFLVMIMVFGMFVGCSKETTEENVDSVADTDSSARVSMTLSLWLPTDENTTEEAVTLVENAINDLTRAKYDTAIELNAIPRSEYQEAVNTRIDEIAALIEAEEEAAKQKKKELKEKKAQNGGKNVETESESLEESEEETIVNDLGITIKLYPEVSTKQLDIFLIQSYDEYVEYIKNEQIMRLDEELGSNSKILKSYIYPTFLEIANLDGTYAIPNNHPVGEYQYLLVNKELVEKYDYDPEDLETFLKCGDFIKDIGFQNLDGVVPLLGNVEAANMVYWGGEDSDWSAIASQITNSASFDSVNSPKNVFTISVYANTVKLMKELNELNYVGDGTIDEGEKFAVGIISGDPKSIKEYEDDYYVHIYSKPMFQEEDVFGAMFAVSSYTKSLSRSMEIITYLNTNSDIRTILQYGVEGVHWKYDDEETKDTISILSNDYKMNLLETGNVYMTYPGEGISMKEWEYGKLQNLDSISNPFIKFDTHITEENKAAIAELDLFSKSIKEKLDSCSAAEMKSFITKMKEEVRNNETVKALLNASNPDSIVTIYNLWYDEQYPD